MELGGLSLVDFSVSIVGASFDVMVNIQLDSIPLFSCKVQA